MQNAHRIIASLHIASCIFALLSGMDIASAAGPAGKAKCPDLTRGGTVPKGWNHDWTLGPTGARGWIYSDAHVTTDARQIKITAVEKGSPSDGVLEVGDVVTGVRGRPFGDDARILFGKSITEAEKDENRGELHLIRWRRGKTDNVIIKLQPMGTYSRTAPFNCPKSRRILRQGSKAMANDMKENPTKGHVITRALNATALLASGNREYLPVIREQVRLLSQFDQFSSVCTWQYAYINIFLAEYVLATGDRTHVDRGLRRITNMIVDGQSAIATWGHAFADPKTKILGGYGMMNAPGIPLTYSLALASKAGLRNSRLDSTVRKSAAFIRFYSGKGSIGYGEDRGAWIETHCDNGKNEMACVLFDFLGDVEPTEFFSRMAVASHGSERDTGHTGNFFNMTWALHGVARSGPVATGAWLREFGWYYDLARRWDGTFLHQGGPGQRTDTYRNWDSTGAYLLGYAHPLKKTYLTGRKPSVAPQIDRRTAEGLLNDGHGWSNKDRRTYYGKLGTGELLRRLSSWSPIVRERSSIELGRRGDDVVAQLTRMLKSSDRYSRYGACQAIQLQRGRAAAAIPALRKALAADDLPLQLLAIEALSGIGKPARVAVPELLALLARGTNPTRDPRSMLHRYLCFALFSPRNGLIGQSLEGVDRQLLVRAVRAGLKNVSARARGNLGSVYRNLSYNEIKPLLPAILQAIKEPAPSGRMFAHEIRFNGLELLHRNRIDEGIELLADYTKTQNKWHSESRILRLLKFLESYGAHAKRVIPKLREVVHYFENEERDYPHNLSLGKAAAVKASIKRIEASKDYPKLIHLNPSRRR